MLKNVKVKDLTELNNKFDIKHKDNMVCRNNYEFTLPLLFNKHYLERVLILDEQCNLVTIYSITYDEVKYDSRT